MEKKPKRNFNHSGKKPPSTPRTKPKPHVATDEPMRLNKFIAHCGVCSRRQAADLVKQGAVQVNGETITEPFVMVTTADKVTVQGKPVELEERKVYLLLNKPKNTITTLNDEKDRKTVMDLITDVPERIYPVGRLDRATTGLLLLTNDGDLAKKLAHPSHEVKKFYQATLDKDISPADLEKIAAGLILEDGPVKVNGIDYVRGSKKNEVGLEIHVGRNRIVRRIFEHLGYEVVRLDRTYYAGLTKKDLPRGWYRHLTEKEIIMLKHFI